jgi:hypothetical protein
MIPVPGQRSLAGRIVRLFNMDFAELSKTTECFPTSSDSLFERFRTVDSQNVAHADESSGRKNSLARDVSEDPFSIVTEICFFVFSESTNISKTSTGTEL